MGKVNKVVVFGKTKTGKTAILNKIIYPDSNMVGIDLCPTIEDIYMGQIETDRTGNGAKGTEKERVCFYDTAGLESPMSEVPKHYISMADGFILVYSIDSADSFQCVEKLKRDIDKYKEKKEVTIVVLGNKSDLEANRQVSKRQADSWAAREKVILREASVTDRRTIFDPVVQLVSKMTQPPTEKGSSTDHHLLHPSTFFHGTASSHAGAHPVRSKSPNRGILKGMTSSIGRKASNALGLHPREPRPKEAKVKSAQTQPAKIKK